MKKYIFIIILLFAISYAPYIIMAQVKLETALPDLPNAPASSASSGLPGYINYLFIFGLGLITVLALGQMMFGGIQYILAAGNVTKVEDAKDTIQQALIGLGLLLVSYLLLRTINPDLVNLRNPNLTPTEFKGNIISGEQAGNTTWQDIKNAPVGTMWSYGGTQIIKNTSNTILTTDSLGQGGAVEQNLDKMPTGPVNFSAPLLNPDNTTSPTP